NNITLLNLNISNNNDGVYAEYVDHLHIQNCSIVSNDYSGIYLDWGCSNCLISGNYLSNQYDQINIDYGTNCKVYSNNITRGSRGIYVYRGSGNEIIGNNIISHTNYGLYIYESQRMIKDNYLKNSYYGIRYRGNTECKIYNLTVIGSTWSVYLNYYAQLTIYNSTLGTGRLELEAYSHLILVNTIFLRTNVSYKEESSKLTVMWYLTVCVVTNGNIPMPGVRVKVNDTFDKLIYNETTNISGICDLILCTEYIENSTTRVTHTPHNVTCISSMGTGYVEPEPVMDFSKFVKVIIIDRIPPLTDAGSDIVIDQHENVTFDGTGSTDNMGILNWTWSFEYNYTPIQLYGPTPWFIFDLAGKYNVTLTVTDGVNEAMDNMWVTVNDITTPVADAGANITINQHEAAVFDGSGSSDNVEIFNLTWAFEYNERNIELFGAQPKFIFDIAGEYNVSLSVSDEAENLDIDYVMVFVTDITPPDAHAGYDQTINQHESVFFDGSASTDNVGVTNWTWTFEYDSEEIKLFGSKTSFVFHTAGSYLVTLRVTDEKSNWAEDDLNISVKDITPPVANAGENITVDQHQKVRFYGLESTDNIGITNWTWSFMYLGRQVILYGPEPEFVFDEPGVYAVTLKVTDAASNRGEDYLSVFVKDITAPFADAGLNFTVYENQTVTLVGSGSWDNLEIRNWTWEFKYEGKTVRLYGQTVKWTFAHPGNYTIKLIVRDEAGNWASDTLWINVLPRSPDIGPDEDLNETKDDDEPSSNLGITIAIIAIIIIILICIGLFFFVFKKKKERPRKIEGEPLISTGPPATEPQVATPQGLQPQPYLQPAPRVVPQPAGIPIQSTQPLTMAGTVPLLPPQPVVEPEQPPQQPLLPPPALTVQPPSPQAQASVTTESPAVPVAQPTPSAEVVQPPPAQPLHQSSLHTPEQMLVQSQQPATTPTAQPYEPIQPSNEPEPEQKQPPQTTNQE
ncbi:PKD domain-containing protein, partial [[Eubacterium] cellulosolvens]